MSKRTKTWSVTRTIAGLYASLMMGTTAHASIDACSEEIFGRVTLRNNSPTPEFAQSGAATKISPSKQPVHKYEPLFAFQAFPADFGFAARGYYALSPNKQLIATKVDDLTVAIFDLRTGKLVKSITPPFHTGPYFHRGLIEFIRFSKDGQQLVVASEDNQIAIYSATGELIENIARFQDQNNRIRLLSVDMANDRLVATSATGGTEVWDLSHGNAHLQQVFKAPGAQPRSSVIAPRSDRIVTLEGEYAILWSMKEQSYLANEFVKALFKEATFNHQGDRIALRTVFPHQSDKVFVIDGQLRLSQFVVEHDRILSMQFSPSGRYLTTTGVNNGTKVWSGDDGKLRYTLRDKRALLDTSFNNDETLVLTVSVDGELDLWKLESDEEPKPIRISSPVEKIVAAQFVGANRIMTINSVGQVAIRLLGRNS